MNPIILSCSLHPNSRSQVLANFLKEKMPNAELISLKDYPLPLCDGSSAYLDKNVALLKEKIEQSSGIIITTPVYNYNTNAALKNFIELLGKSCTNKVVAFALAAGGKFSYMAPLSIMNSLMLDFRCFIVPRFVYSTANDFNEQRSQITSEDVKERLIHLKENFEKMSMALKGMTLD